ncbi:MAG: Phosphoribosyltransferase [Candidatus Uhrbacteria bacterium GW2011_GWA2_52_8d]|uniref:Phosphoribosyltransferase n=1 Tax=Candidatus Uhrbacteria bacterium GW2011_GWA2_52_8d TaxID=1618979 RepID=A0A0G1XQ00_9BACT|nr:MAG: Phosphoribosyltransferase [Candidatus Uhrbacteria bacterium GW2011_GWA2_52_8d]
MESRLRHLAVEALFPRFCVACRREGALMCRQCLDLWTPVPPQVSCAFCGRGGSPRTCSECRDDRYLDGLTYFVPYGNALMRELIVSWKFHGDRSVEDVFVKSLRRAAPRMQPPLAPYWVTWVPLHESRLRSRGFDQAQRVATWAGELFGLPVETLIRRSKKTAQQSRTIHGQRRVGEMDTIFELAPGIVVPDHVLLCDDVFTSGTTIDAAARLLKENGAKTVWGFTLAKGRTT